MVVLMIHHSYHSTQLVVLLVRTLSFASSDIRLLALCNFCSFLPSPLNLLCSLAVDGCPFVDPLILRCPIAPKEARASWESTLGSLRVLQGLLSPQQKLGRRTGPASIFLSFPAVLSRLKACGCPYFLQLAWTCYNFYQSTTTKLAGENYFFIAGQITFLRPVSLLELTEERGLPRGYPCTMVTSARLATGRFDWVGPWNALRAAARFGITPRVNRRDGRSVYKAHLFEPSQHTIIFLLTHNVHPKKSGQSEARVSDIYFLDEMFYEDTEILTPSQLASIIISCMTTLARVHDSDVSFGLPRLLSWIFEHHRVRLERQRRQLTDHTATVTTQTLRLIHIEAIEMMGAAAAMEEEEEVPRWESQDKAGPSTRPSTTTPATHEPTDILAAIQSLHMDMTTQFQNLNQRVGTLEDSVRELLNRGHGRASGGLGGAGGDPSGH